VGANCTVSVVFTPSGAAARAATLSLADSAPNSPQTVSLSGAGTAPAISVSPGSVAFGNQPLGVAGTAQTVTVTNTGTAALGSLAVSVGGTNATDFAETTSCGTNLAVGASCTVSIVFTPSAVASRSATLSVAGNAPNSPQTLSLSGTGTVPYSLSAAQPTATVAPGSSAVYTVQLSAASGTTLTSAVQLSCSGAPSTTTCTVAPASVAAGSSGQTLTVTVTTTAPTTGDLRSMPFRGAAPAAWAFLSGFMLLGVVFRRRRKALALVLLLAGTLSSATLLIGCAPTKTGNPGTTAGSYTLTVTAQSATYQTTQNLTLTVQ
jgi:hypothetical protein